MIVLEKFSFLLLVRRKGLKIQQYDAGSCRRNYLWYSLQHITEISTTIKRKSGEFWKPLIFEGHKGLRKRYALSSLGRVASFHKDWFEDGKLLRGSLTTGYQTLNLHRPGHKGSFYIHREIAKLFLKKPSAKHRYVIHRNHNRLDNRVVNLRWTTLKEMLDHQQKSPAKLDYKLRQANRETGLKLTAGQVRKIKEQLNNPKRKATIRQIADKYGVSEMTIYRIKSGENWGRI